MITSSQYTAAVEFIEQYVRNTDILFQVATPGKFDDVRGQLQQALLILKESPDFLPGAETIN